MGEPDAEHAHGLSFPRQRINYWRQMPNSGRTAIRHFTPQMFTICMGTGILAVLLNRNPYQFRGLFTISIIVWLLDIVLFALISLAFLTRWILFSSQTAKLFETEVEQTTYLSTTSIAFATIVELLALICGASWDRWEIVSFAFWWAAVALSLAASLTTYFLLIRDEQVHVENITPTLLYPVTGIVATAAAGAVVGTYTPLEVNLAQPTIIVSFLLLGAGLLFGLGTVTSYFIRLLSNQNPPPKKAAAEFIPVAPFSNAAYAFSALGYLAGPKRNLLADYGNGTVADAEIGRAVYGAAFMMSLIVFGFATFWLILATITFLRDVRKTTFNINMWSAAYPIGAYGVAASQLSSDLDSTAFKVITSIVLVVLVVYWLMLVVYTVPALISGELLLSEAKEEMDEEKKKREEGGEGEGGRDEDEQGGGSDSERRRGRGKLLGAVPGEVTEPGAYKNGPVVRTSTGSDETV